MTGNRLPLSGSSGVLLRALTEDEPGGRAADLPGAAAIGSEARRWAVLAFRYEAMESA